MQTLSTNQRPLVFLASQLPDQQRALLPVCSLDDAAIVSGHAGQAVSYNSKESLFASYTLEIRAESQSSAV